MRHKCTSGAGCSRRMQCINFTQHIYVWLQLCQCGRAREGQGEGVGNIISLTRFAHCCASGGGDRVWHILNSKIRQRTQRIRHFSLSCISCISCIPCILYLWRAYLLPFVIIFEQPQCNSCNPCTCMLHMYVCVCVASTWGPLVYTHRHTHKERH